MVYLFASRDFGHYDKIKIKVKKENDDVHFNC